jgi:hypothetical protein
MKSSGEFMSHDEIEEDLHFYIGHKASQKVTTEGIVNVSRTSTTEWVTFPIRLTRPAEGVAVTRWSCPSCRKRLEFELACKEETLKKRRSHHRTQSIWLATFLLMIPAAILILIFGDGAVIFWGDALAIIVGFIALLAVGVTGSGASHDDGLSWGPRGTHTKFSPEQVRTMRELNQLERE